MLAAASQLRWSLGPSCCCSECLVIVRLACVPCTACPAACIPSLPSFLLLRCCRSGAGVSLRRALSVSLQCPLLCPEVMRGRERLAERWRPVWQQGGEYLVQPGCHASVTDPAKPGCSL